MLFRNVEAQYRSTEIIAQQGKAAAWFSHRRIAAGATVLLTGISLFAAPPGSTYRWAFLFLVPLVWAVYGLRNQVALAAGHFILFVGALLFHELGALGFYDRLLLGLRFDTYVHFVFGLVAGLIIGRALRLKLLLTGWQLWAGVALLVLGLGGAHELIECGTTLLLGPEKGMLKMRPDQPFDTQKDLLNNLLGALTALLSTRLARRQSV